MHSRSAMTDKAAYTRLCQDLQVARNEIFNLRQQIRTLKHSHHKSIDEIRKKLMHWKCQTCVRRSAVADSLRRGREPHGDEMDMLLRPIGIITTDFRQRRGIPRQASVCPKSQASLTLFKSVFTNPEHALEGLDEYSHMWILFHFHKLESQHVPAKVSPPRLGGTKTGVFATRSPHRPSPIGLSLVRIEYVHGSTVYFSGVDMLDKTPVIDIKPYIPRYDDPAEVEFDVRLPVKPMPPGSPGIFPGNREEPDGEESDEDHLPPPLFLLPHPQTVRVPSWVTTSTPKAITFNEEAEEQLERLGKGDLKPVIKHILSEDPRSNYIKQKYSNQFYTFLITDLHISCKFDDTLNTVTVYRINRASRLSEHDLDEASGYQSDSGPSSRKEPVYK